MQALSAIVGLDLVQADVWIPPEEEADRNHIIEKATQPIILEDESKLYPLLIWNFHHGVGLSVLPEE